MLSSMIVPASWPALLTGLSLAVGNAAANPASAAPDAVTGWEAVPAILARIVPPTFAPREFNLTNFGAVANGTNLCTGAFRDAIAACHAAGGGRVVVPPGRFHTGPIHLRSHVELHLSEGAELVFSDRFEDYLPPVFVRVGGIELYNYSPLIYARDCVNIAITGPGRLNGNARAWWDWKTRETRESFAMGARGVPVEQRVFGTPEAAIRPSFVSFVHCTNILLEGFTIGSGPNWTLHPIYCENVTIRRVHVVTDGPNNDGIDPDSCRDVLIEDCTFSTGDDCVVLKSGYNEDGWRVGRPTENVIVRRCFSRRGHGGLVIGSEMSGGVRNVFMEDCEFDGTDRAVRVKSRADRGGVVENLFVRNVRARNLRREVVIVNMDYTSDRNQMLNPTPPVFRNFVLQNITAEGAPTAILITGLETSPIRNLHFENLAITASRGVVARHTTGLTFDGVRITPERGPVFDLKDTRDLSIRGAVAPPGMDVFLKLEGAGSANVRIRASDLAGARQKYILGPDVPGDAVMVE
jgi:polygalacturonase